jgi:hypothetical protein
VSEHPAPTSHRRRRGRRWALVVALVAAALVAAVGYGVVRLVDSPGSDSPTGAKASPTPLASMDLRRLPVARTSPCDRVAEDDVATALGGQVEVSERYAPGDRVAMARGLRDVSSEFGCTYRDASGAEARLWVFARPVNRPVASRIVREAKKKGCQVVQGGPGFGSPTVTTTCPAPQPRLRSVTLRGLFGDAWLTCQLTLPTGASGDDPVRRTQRWCVGVVTRLGAQG